MSQIKSAIYEGAMEVLQQASEECQKKEITKGEYHLVVCTVITLLITLYATLYTKNDKEFISRASALIEETLRKYHRKKEVNGDEC
jgi:dolichol kinase